MQRLMQQMTIQETETPAVEQSQDMAKFEGHHGKRGHFKDDSEQRETRMATAEKQNQLIDLLLDQDASSVDGVDALQKELADINNQLDVMKQEAEAAHDEKEAKRQEGQSGERLQLTDEEKATREAKHEEMEAKREKALELVKQKNDILDQLIEKLS